MKSVLFFRFALLGIALGFGFPFAWAASVSDSEAIAIADSALLDIPYELDAPITVARTNGAAVVTFPGFRDVFSTNTPPHAAIVWIDEETSAILPNPGLVPMSDSEAIQIATNQVPISFDHSKAVRIDRASSLTRVTLPASDLETVPGVFFTNGFASRIWIDTQTKAVIEIEIPAD